MDMGGGVTRRPAPPLGDLSTFSQGNTLKPGLTRTELLITAGIFFLCGIIAERSGDNNSHQYETAAKPRKKEKEKREV